MISTCIYCPRNMQTKNQFTSSNPNDSGYTWTDQPDMLERSARMGVWAILQPTAGDANDTVVSTRGTTIPRKAATSNGSHSYLAASWGWDSKQPGVTIPFLLIALSAITVTQWSVVSPISCSLSRQSVLDLPGNSLSWQSLVGRCLHHLTVNPAQFTSHFHSVSWLITCLGQFLPKIRELQKLLEKLNVEYPQVYFTPYCREQHVKRDDHKSTT